MTEGSAQVSGLDLKDWRYSVDGEDIAWAVFDREGESMNSLGRRPIEELARIITQVESDIVTKKIRGLVIRSGKERGFIVGADIREFETFTNEQDVTAALKPVNELF